MKGKFIVFEGIDGSGKTTQIKLLAEELAGRGHMVLVTREPGGTRVGEAVRELLLKPVYGQLEPVTETFLYAAARAQHVAEVIRPALNEGRTVLCDRFTDSTLAYQGFGRGLSLQLLEQLNRAATGGLEPDLVLVLDFNTARGQDRIRRAGRDADRIEQEKAEFHLRVRSGYLTLAGRDSRLYKLIDANRPVGQVQREISALVGELIECPCCEI